MLIILNIRIKRLIIEYFTIIYKPYGENRFLDVKKDSKANCSIFFI